MDDSSTISEGLWDLSVQCDNDNAIYDAKKNGQITTETKQCKGSKSYEKGDDDGSIPLYLSISSDGNDEVKDAFTDDSSEDDDTCNFGLGIFHRFLNRKLKSDRIAYKIAAKRVQIEEEDIYISKQLSEIWSGEIGLTMFAPLGVDIPNDEGACNLPTPSRSNVKVRRSTESCEYHLSFSCSSEDEIDFTSDDEIESCPPILSQEQMREIHRMGLPPSCRLMTWTRAYSLRRDGDYFFTMFNKCKSFKHSLVVVKTTDGDILGGYADTFWGGLNNDGTYQTSKKFFGGGQTFLFASNPDLKENQTENHSSQSLQFYRWTGENYYSQLCDLERGRLGMGGDGCFGFLIEKDFCVGSTGYCSTFKNPPLTKGDDGNFFIVDVEVYGFSSLASKHSDCGSSGIASMSSFVSLSSIL